MNQGGENALWQRMRRGREFPDSPPRERAQMTVNRANGADPTGKVIMEKASRKGKANKNGGRRRARFIDLILFSEILAEFAELVQLLREVYKICNV